MLLFGRSIIDETENSISIKGTEEGGREPLEMDNTVGSTWWRMSGIGQHHICGTEIQLPGSYGGGPGPGRLEGAMTTEQNWLVYAMECGRCRLYLEPFGFDSRSNRGKIAFGRLLWGGQHVRYLVHWNTCVERWQTKNHRIANVNCLVGLCWNPW